MKNKKNIKKMLMRVGRRVWGILSRNIALKLLSMLFAVFLYSFVVTTNPSITRLKTISDMDISVAGLSVLSGRGLALLTDISQIGEARVSIEAPQSAYSLVSEDNVRVEIDLSSIRDPGTRTLRLRGSSTYGAVKQIWPEYVTVEVENQLQRYAPVNAVITGDDSDNYWYSITRLNPSQVVVTGPESYVQLLSSALVDIDVTGKTAPINRVEDFTLRDSENGVLSDKLSASTSSVSVAVDIYPKKRVKISSQIDDVVTGLPPAGYRIESVSISPDTITVAGDEALLNEVETLTVVPVDVSQSRNSFTSLAKIQSLKGIKYLSLEDITVSVTMIEENLVKRFSNVAVECVNLPPDCECTLSASRVDLRVTGPYSRVRSMTRGDVGVIVDLSGLEPGQYELPVEFVSDNFPQTQGDASPETVAVTVTRKEQTP